MINEPGNLAPVRGPVEPGDGSQIEEVEGVEGLPPVEAPLPLETLPMSASYFPDDIGWDHWKEAPNRNVDLAILDPVKQKEKMRPR